MSFEPAATRRRGSVSKRRRNSARKRRHIYRRREVLQGPKESRTENHYLGSMLCVSAMLIVSLNPQSFQAVDLKSPVTRRRDSVSKRRRHSARKRRHFRRRREVSQGQKIFVL